MIRTVYEEVSTGKILNEEEFFDRIFKEDEDVKAYFYCMECGVELGMKDLCDCEHIDEEPYGEDCDEYNEELEYE